MTQRVLLVANGYQDGVFLAHAKDSILDILGTTKEVLFVPNAWSEEKHDMYLELFRETIEPWGRVAVGLHNSEHMVEVVRKAQAIFVGGGNTFRLLTSLHRHPGLCEAIRNRVIQDGVPYIGVSAGAVIATPAILTTASKPIAYPRTLRGLALVPYLLNPHYGHVRTQGHHVQESESSRQQGEDADIFEVAHLPGVPPVVGLPNGSLLLHSGSVSRVLGTPGAIVFQKYDKKISVRCGADLPASCVVDHQIPDNIAGPAISSL